MEYPKIKRVKALDNYLLEVTFENEVIKLYDCKPLLAEPSFEDLRNKAFFKLAENNSCPYAIIWSDDVDLAESEIWINGKNVVHTTASNTV